MSEQKFDEEKMEAARNYIIAGGLRFQIGELGILQSKAVLPSGNTSRRRL